MEQIIKDDVIFQLQRLPNLLLWSNKWARYTTFFVAQFLIIEAVICGVVFCMTLNKEFWSKYCLFAAGSSIAFSNYFVTFTHKGASQAIYNEIFPNLWSLHSGGEESFKQICKIGKLVKCFMFLSVISAFGSSTIGLPLFGDGYDIYIPVRVFTDYLGEWVLPFLIIFYVSFYHVGLTIISNAFILVYYVLHLKIQYFLLNQRLEKMKEEEEDLDVIETMTNKQYQDYITQELIFCIKHHKQLLRFANRLNRLVYYPIFFFTISGVLVGAALVFYLKNIDTLVLENIHNAYLRGAVVGATGSLLTTAFCISGQLLVNESENLYNTAVTLPWYLWNVKNRKIYQMLLMKSQTPTVLSSSGIVTINHELFISLYKCIYSVMTFLMNFF